MKLYSDNSQYSHRVRFLAAEKRVALEQLAIDHDNISELEKLAHRNPELVVPMLEDKDGLLLFEVSIIMAYLEERFPYPALMDSSPAARAVCRQRAWRLEQNLADPAQIILTKPRTRRAESARVALAQGITELLPIFRDSRWFMSDGFGLLDCCLAPLLWRLPSLGVDLDAEKPSNRPLFQYMKRVFSRPAFLASLTDNERDIHRKKSAQAKPPVPNSPSGNTGGRATTRAGMEAEPVCKPGSVAGQNSTCGNHSSGTDVTIGLERSNPKPTAGSSIGFLFDLAPDGVYTATTVTSRAVRSYRTFSPLPDDVP